MKNYCIGIDFGTTKTLVAYPSEQGRKPEIAHLGRERNSLPTSVFIGETGSWEFGDDADDYACDAGVAERYVSRFKLKLGSQSSVVQVFNDDSFSSYTARDVTAAYLRHVRETCEKEVFNGHAVSGAVITHPVHFTPAQIADLRNAAEKAGFSEIKLMREPEAAGLAFCQLSPQEVFNGTALVVDWGGGTLDLALVSREDGSVKVHNNYVAGSDTIGGDVFDELLWKYVSERLRQEHGVTLAEDSIDHIRLQKKKIRSVKEKLSRSETAMLSIAGNRGAYPTLKITRTDLEATLRPHIESGLAEIQNLLARIKEQSLRPTQVLLIGGSSQIPLIGKLIEETTGLPCRRWQYSHEAVALGAAFQQTIFRTINRAESDIHLAKIFKSRLPNLEYVEYAVKRTIADILKIDYSQVAITSIIGIDIFCPDISAEEEYQEEGEEYYSPDEEDFWETLQENLSIDLPDEYKEQVLTVGELILKLAEDYPNFKLEAPSEHPTYAIALTKEECQNGCTKRFHIDGFSGNLQLPPRVSIGDEIYFSTDQTGIWGGICIIIHNDTFTLHLTEEEFEQGAERYIHLNEFHYLEIPILPDSQPHTYTYNFENLGSVFIKLLLVDDEDDIIRKERALSPYGIIAEPQKSQGRKNT